MLKVEINTDKYKWVWGKKPMGDGSWMLKVKRGDSVLGIINHRGALNKAEVRRTVLSQFPEEYKGGFNGLTVEVMS